ncbi:MAG TPA: hypothetical protein PK280_02590 [Planctomycetota bacterium]|nr:hypothetical protein [Planctomycetota bacterium]
MLPEVEALPDPGRIAAGAALANWWRPTRYIVLEIDSSGAVCLDPDSSRRATPWRGIDLPLDVGPCQLPGPPIANLDEVVVHVGLRPESPSRPFYRIRDWETDSLGSLGAKLQQLKSCVASPIEIPVIVNARAEVPFGLVAGAVAEIDWMGFPVEFRPSGGAASGDAVSPEALAGLVAGFSGRVGLDRSGCSALGVVLRVDARAPFRCVQQALAACAAAKVWRVTFAVVCQGRERVLGRPAASPRTCRPGPFFWIDEGLSGMTDLHQDQLRASSRVANIPPVTEGAGDVRDSRQ